MTSLREGTDEPFFFFNEFIETNCPKEPVRKKKDLPSLAESIQKR